MKRQAVVERATSETVISMELNIDGSGLHDISTEIGFFDHMLTQVARHGFFDIYINTKGDIEVDCHHTVEDTGIVLGKAFAQALGDRAGIKRYGQAIVPMEDALVLLALDISGRAFLQFDVEFSMERLGNMDTEMVEEFFRAFCSHAGVNIHIKQMAGKNNHHVAEAIFKAFGRALDEATSLDPRIIGVHSSKGMLEKSAQD